MKIFFVFYSLQRLYAIKPKQPANHCKLYEYISCNIANYFKMVIFTAIIFWIIEIILLLKKYQ